MSLFKRLARGLRAPRKNVEPVTNTKVRPWLLILPLLVFCLSLFTATDYMLKRQKLGFLHVGHDTFVLLQAYREVDRFLEALNSYVFHDTTEPVSHEDLLLRFELLASRIPLLMEGEVGKRISAFPGMREMAQALENSLAGIEPLLARLAPDAASADYQMIRQALLRDRNHLFDISRDFLVDTESRGAAILSEFKESKGYGYLAAVVLSGLLMLMLYISQLSRTLRTSAALAQESDQLRKAKAKLSYQATHDALTGLINRAEFERRLQRVVTSAQLRGTEGALLYLDMDRFKVVNDSCGHFAGDQLLRQAASLIRSRVRKRDTLARLGGDEFAVLLEHCALPEALQVAEGIREVIRKFRFTWDSKTFEVGLSIGIAPVNPASESLQAVLMAADDSCYTAKDGGRNCIHVYREDIPVVGRRDERLQWATRIEQGLENNRLHLYRQVIAPLSRQQDAGEYYEILMRLGQEEGELATPEAFLRAAERYHLVTALDRRVIEQFFAWLAAHPARLDALGIGFINLSGPSLEEVDTREFIVTQLERSKIPPQKICFEIAEEVAIANLGAAIDFMEFLRVLGCRFALDDFGSGMSSFSYLKHLPVDFIKIDGSMVRDVLKDPVDCAMVTSIHRIASVMGKRTIAEFVESAAILERLRSIGVDFAQGYGIARPYPLADAEDMCLPTLAAMSWGSVPK